MWTNYSQSMCKSLLPQLPSSNRITDFLALQPSRELQHSTTSVDDACGGGGSRGRSVTPRVAQRRAKEPERP
jgi:hypothetical protein